MTNVAALAERVRDSALLEALERAFDGISTRLALVGVRCGRASAQALVTDGASGGAPEIRMRVGCLAKLLTATLALRLFADARIAIDTRLSEILGSSSARAVEHVTLRHLLEHTHGLDDSLLRPPVLTNGFIDREDLARRVAASAPLAPPGAVYSYGSAGAWLIAAALERVFGRTYAVLLHRELLLPLGIRGGGDEAPAPAPASVCAATGGTLSFTVAEWLALLRFAADLPELRDASAAEAVTPLPGWSPLERGVRLGFKHHGGRWFGHQSVWPGSHAFVRLSREHDTELVVLSRDHAASIVAARVFGDAAPELFDLRLRVPLPGDSATDLRAVSGRYESARYAARIAAAAAGGGLELHVHDRREGSFARAGLVPAGANAFFVRPPALETFHWIERVQSAAGEWLWNGRFVLRRL